MFVILRFEDKQQDTTIPWSRKLYHLLVNKKCRFFSYSKLKFRNWCQGGSHLVKSSNFLTTTSYDIFWNSNQRNYSI